MIRDADFFARWELDCIRAEPPDFHRNLAIFEAMWEEAVALGVFPPKDPLEGLEMKIHMARVLNALTPPGNDRGCA